MNFKPKVFIQEQVAKGKTLEEASFLLGFKSAIESVKDMNENHVVDKLNMIFTKLKSN